MGKIKDNNIEAENTNNEYQLIVSDDNDVSLEQDEKCYPLVPMRGAPVFPGMIWHFDVGREKSILALETAMKVDQTFVLSVQKDITDDAPTKEDIYDVGVIVKVKQLLRLPQNGFRVLVEVFERVEILEYKAVEPYFLVSTEILQEEYQLNKETLTLMRMVKDNFENYLSYLQPFTEGIMVTLDAIENPHQLINIIASNLDVKMPIAQSLLAEKQAIERLEIMYKVLLEEIEFVKIEKRIDAQVQKAIQNNQKEFVLREKMRAIQEELGDDDSDENDHTQYKKRLEELEVSEEVYEKVSKEIKRLERIPKGSSEYSVTQNYIEWILDLPWNISTEENVDVKKARKILNRDHYALEKVKERILEHLSVLELSKNMKGPILCLVGPPGVGKTSIAKSIAESLNRKFIRMSLGGVRDEAEIRGHRRTYVGAVPGRIIYHIKQVKSNNPLFLFDEIDKVSMDFRGDPTSALLEVLDPEQNSTFTDHYLELPFDLSKVLFLTTANSIETIPEPLLDRIEVINVNGYISAEKYEIAKQYLIPKQIKEHGLIKTQLKISPQALKDVIEYHTREAGVRELNRKIGQICRRAARQIVEGEKETITVSKANLEEYLGKKEYDFDVMSDKKATGLVNGLAWTSVGGDTLEIEVSVLKGSGKLSLTGQLGDVMKESANAAITYIRSRSSLLGIEDSFYEEKDIHIHVPEGAIPKDGPSAGITMATALISALTEKPIDRTLAMTGEITLRGRVLPIGGLREKLTAAHRAKIKKVLIPEKNKKDLEEIPESVLKDLEIVPVNTMDDVIKEVFGA
jgi:ATP-dependent Lon protease